MRDNTIGDIYYRNNDADLQNLIADDWNYTTTFDLPDANSAMFNQKNYYDSSLNYYLTLQQVDSISSVTLNGHLVGTTQSMFVSYKFDVTQFLQQKQNTLIITIKSPLNYSRNLNAAAVKDNYPMQWIQFYNAWTEPSSRVYIRKTQSDFGWDWGPSLSTSGIYGDVSIISSTNCNAFKKEYYYKNAMIPINKDSSKNYFLDNDKQLSFEDYVSTFIDTISVNYTLSKDLTEVYATVDLVLNTQFKCLLSDTIQQSQLNIEVVDMQTNKPVYSSVVSGSDTDAKKTIANLSVTDLQLESVGTILKGLDFSFKITDPTQQLWWPYQLGKQNYYQVNLTISNTQIKQSFKMSKKVSFRSVEIVQSPLPCQDDMKDPNCLSFYFKVNNIPIFTKGSNYIPQDALKDRVTLDQFQYLVDSTIKGNQNMIRIWGGGYYLPDAFYAYLDQRGVMVWQEFMFACGAYPSDGPFLKLIQEEVTFQSLRLSPYSSVVVFGGNNENEAGASWYSSFDSQLYFQIYAKLYETVHTSLKSVNTHTAWVDSSPSNGLFSADPYYKKWMNVYSADIGDTHFYNYDMDCLDVTQYTKSRYISEHGFLSFPSFNEYQNYYTNIDFKIYSDVNLYRLKHQDGYEEVKKQLAMHFVSFIGNSTNKKQDSENIENNNIENNKIEDNELSSMVNVFRFAYASDEEFLLNHLRCMNLVLADQYAVDKTAPVDAVCLKLFARFLHLSQLHQGLCYETSFSYWRHLAWTSSNTMGVLYWQMNDTWPGPSWSTTEYSLKPRASFYSVQNAYKPLMLYANISSSQLFKSTVTVNTLDVNLVIDTNDLKEYQDKNDQYTLTVKYYKFNEKNSSIVGSENSTFDYTSNGKSVYSNGSTIVQNSDVALLKVVGKDKAPVFESTKLLRYPKDFEFIARSSVTVTGVKFNADKHTIVVSVASSELSLYVYLECSLVGSFEASNFTMEPKEIRELVFTTKQEYNNNKNVYDYDETNITFTSNCLNCPNNVWTNQPTNEDKEIVYK